MSKALFCIDIQVDHFPMGMLEVENSSEFDNWLNEVVFDLDNFRSAKPKEDTQEADSIPG